MDRAEMEVLLFKIDAVFPPRSSIPAAAQVIRLDEWMSSTMGTVGYESALEAWERWKNQRDWAPTPHQLFEGVRAVDPVRRLVRPHNPELADGVTTDHGRERARQLREDIRRPGQTEDEPSPEAAAIRAAVVEICGERDESDGLRSL